MKGNYLISTEPRYEPCFNGYDGINRSHKNIKRSHSYLLNVLAQNKKRYQSHGVFEQESYNMALVYAIKLKSTQYCRLINMNHTNTEPKTPMELNLISHYLFYPFLFLNRVSFSSIKLRLSCLLPLQNLIFATVGRYFFFWVGLGRLNSIYGDFAVFLQGEVCKTDVLYWAEYNLEIIAYSQSR